MKRLPDIGDIGRLVWRAAAKRPLVGATPAEVVHQENKWRLLRYERPSGNGTGGGRPLYRTPVLLVPSLINRHYVLDLMPGKSFAEAMVAWGHDVFIIDWGTPGPEDRYLTFDDIVDGYLGRAVRVAARCANVPRVHMLGYCLGGTLAVIHAAARPECIASLTLLAAPVAFHDRGLLSAWTRTKAFDVDALVQALGNVPWQLLQSAFHLLRPTLTLSKAVHLLDRAWDDEYLDGFIALETWGNDNVALPAGFYHTMVKQLYRENALIKWEFRLSGKRVRLANITCPTLAVTFEHDNIVPWESAAVLLEAIGAAEKERVHLPGGHVGAVVSRAASKTLWPKLSAWWAAHEQEGLAQAAAATTNAVPPAAKADVGRARVVPPKEDAVGVVTPSVVARKEEATGVGTASVAPRKGEAVVARAGNNVLETVAGIPQNTGSAERMDLAGASEGLGSAPTPHKKERNGQKRRKPS